MRLNIFSSCRWLQLFVGLFLVLYIQCDCPFPKQAIKYGRYLYASKKDAKKAIAPDLYVLKFKCYPGYERIGPRFIQCVDGEWTNVVPVCKKITCFEPPSIAHGNFKIHRTASELLTLGTVVTYSCNSGYHMSDPSACNIICVLDEDGKKAIWAGKVPSCEERKNCTDPGISNHGTRHGDCCSAGNILRYSCGEDFELVGNEEITCLPTGNWSHARPRCRPSTEVYCDLPPAIPHGAVIGQKEGDYFLPSDEAEILCEPGYSYKGISKYIMCKEDGEWKEEFGNCTEIYCNRPDLLENGSILELESTNSTSFPYSFALTYVCDEGYRLLGGDSWRICRGKGWSGTTPHCEAISCPDPGIPENGDREGSDFSVGAKVRFNCFAGYYLLGSFERFCMPNGQWTGELSRCDTSSNYCPNPGVPINGFKNSSRYDIGDKVGFRCGNGYIHVGSEARVCLQNRTWSGIEARCLSPYDYDNTAQVSEILTAKVKEQFSSEMKQYQQALEAQGFVFQTGRWPYPDHDEMLILYFAFDVSGSVEEHNFRKSIDFAKAIVKKVGVIEDRIRVGALTFSSKAENVFLPMHFNTTEEVLKELDKTKYHGGGTAASSALSLIKDNIMSFHDTYFTHTRRNTKTVVFFLSDGKANMGGSPETDAKKLKDMNVDIYCIGITGNERLETLYKIATTSIYSEVERPNVFVLKDYAAFPWIIEQITNGTVDYSQCGLGVENVVNDNRARVLDGARSNKPWPWMAAIFSLKPGMKDTKEAKFLCGGSIINKNFILTAAHGMYENTTSSNGFRLRQKADIFIKLGLTDMTDESKWTIVQDFNVKNMYIHPKYKRGPSFDYDIALLQLDRPITYNSYIRPICLPPKDLPANSTFYSSNEFGWVTGWGHEGIITPGNENPILVSSKHLKEIKLPIQSQEICIKSLQEKKYAPGNFTERMLCAGDGQPGNDVCFGDSGGPLMQSQMNKDGYVYWTQVGIVSWGIGCGIKDSYGYYTHVHKLVEWIEEQMQNATVMSHRNE